MATAPRRAKDIPYWNGLKENASSNRTVFIAGRGEVKPYQQDAHTIFKLLKAGLVTWDTLSAEKRERVLRAYPFLRG